MALLNDEFMEEAKEIAKEEIKQEMKYDFWENLRETLKLANEFIQNLVKIRETFLGGNGIITIDQLPAGTHTNIPNAPIGNIGVDVKNLVYQEIRKNPKIILEIIDYAQKYFGDIKLSELKEKLIQELNIKKDYGK